MGPTKTARPHAEASELGATVEKSTVAPTSDASACGRTVSVGTTFGARAVDTLWHLTHQKNVAQHTIQQHTAWQE